MFSTMSSSNDVGQHIIEFLNEKEIAWMPINLEISRKRNNTYKKILKQYTDTHEMPNYKDLSDHTLVSKRQRLINNYEYIWIDTRCVNQVDVDGDIDPELNTPYFESVSKKKRHYFITGFYGYNKLRSQTKWADVELLAGQGSYAHKSCIVYNSNTNITDYTGNVEEIVSKEGQVVQKKSQQSINQNISSALNDKFGVTGDWKSNNYESARCVALIPSDKTCLVNNCEVHSAVKSWISIGKASCTAKCFVCGEKKINTKHNSQLWKQVKTYFEISCSGDDCGYDQVQDYLDDYCKENDLMKKDGYMMRRSDECVIEYEKISKYADFLDDLFRDAETPLKRTFKKPTSKNNLIKYLDEIHTDIRILKRDSNIIAFSNGYLKLKEHTFHEYNPNKKYTFIGKKFIPLPFDSDWLYSNWSDIECPIFDKIVKDQPDLSNNKDVERCFYGLMGSLHFPTGYDSIKVVPYLFGASGTGKSTIVSVILSTFSPEIVGTINYKEKTFGKSAFIDHDVIIDQDTPSNMIEQFGKTDFQKAVSGEIIAIPIKNQKQEEQHKVEQRMLFCSQYTQDVQDTGEVIRRIAYLQFRPVQSALCSNLEEECIRTELNKVVIKILLARRELIDKYGNKPFHEWGIPYFDSRIDDVLMDNNYIYRMISENKGFRVRKGKKYPFDDFIIQFNEHYRGQPNRPKKPKVTDVMFTKMGLNVIKDTICKDCCKPFAINIKCCENHSRNNKTTRYYIDGLFYQESEYIYKSNKDNYSNSISSSSDDEL